MKGGKRPLGYTVVEVMIVLAVSGLMFLVAANFISGKQKRTAFTSGVNEMAARVQDVIDQVNTGKYSDIPITCSYVSGGAAVVASDATFTEEQGTASGCVFLGKIMHFSVHGKPEKYEVISVAGGRDDGKLLADIGPSAIPSLTTQQTIPQRLDIHNLIKINIGAGLKEFDAIGFLQSLPSKNEAQDVLKNEAQTVNMYYVEGIDDTMDTPTAEAQINGARLKPATNAVICLTDDKYYAEIRLGSSSNDNQLSVKVKMLGTTACV